MNTWTPDEALEMTGFSGMQWLVFTVAGLAWAADACAVMLLSFVGPAVSVHALHPCHTSIPVAGCRYISVCTHDNAS